MLHRPCLLLVLFSFFSTFVIADQDVERQIAQHLDAQLDESTVLLKQLVNINSGTMNFAGVKQVGMLLKHQYDALGFTTQWLDGAEFDRAGHLVATHESISHPNAAKILLIGHLDTVFAKDDDFQTITELANNRIAGPGITDMKGGDVIMLAALQALQKQGLLQQLNIKVVMTGDEESSGRPLSLSKQAIIDAAIWADIALGFEDGDSNIATAVTSRRGSVNWTLTVKGKPAHSSQIFTDENGDGAIFEAARILNEFRVQLRHEKLLTFNPGLIAGGTRVTQQGDKSNYGVFGKTNVIAKDTLVKGGIRAVSPEQLEQAKAMMQTIVSQNLRHTSAILEFQPGYPPMAQTPANLNLLALYSRVSEDLGYGIITAVDPRNAGAADISFAASHVDMSLDGLGLMGSGGHTKDEVADMSSLAKNMKKAAILIYRLSQ
ncbi:M20/M25/M40 family metallo-hydrolase [uncultured Paraglaciecola sp.]|jgi:glutamate carboxypeptidase|uniref:M20/M25/M40 family metallo-hydrolase n=1 Tax=uncultured Paraglaciecola sp. TaxID=1765024 RepID=UPI0025E5337D|nr:M20/M25/M40 family metallo-hydrolase [uncultured Paraglaciecola sp.]